MEYLRPTATDIIWHTFEIAAPAPEIFYEDPPGLNRPQEMYTLGLAYRELGYQYTGVLDPAGGV